jgi:hypothetical protein
MKRSVHVSAPLLAAAALALTTGCRKPQMQRCVDENNHVVPDSFCQNPTHPPFRHTGADCYDATNHLVASDYCNSPQNVHPTSSGFVYLPMYRYYYGGSGSYGVGSVATGGGYTPSSGASYASSTTRGGFGSSFGGESGSSGHSGGSSGGGE